MIHLLLAAFYLVGTIVLLLLWLRSDRRQLGALEAAQRSARDQQWRALAAESDALAARVAHDRAQAALKAALNTCADLRTKLVTTTGEVAIRELGKVLAERATRAGFGIPGGPISLLDWAAGRLTHIHSEISEAFEALRDGHHTITYGPDGKPEGAEVELADAVIITLALGELLGLDIPRAITEKHKYNLTRPHLHGRKC